VGAVAALIGVQLAPAVLVDDAAITFRYAERIAEGRGFTYNDHERVLGASNPVLTLLLAAAVALGADVEAAARAVCLASFAASAILASLVAARFAGGPAGLVAGLLVSIDPFLRYQVLSGLETGLAICLGLGVILALQVARPGWAGVLLGLAVWNKLDAGLLAIAVAAAWLAVRRSFPWSVAIPASLVVLPWTIFAWAYFGSPIPNSLTAKLQHGEANAFDSLWIARFLLGEARFLLVAGAVGFAASARRLDETCRVALGALGAWFVLHAAALSAIDLGAPYPWYVAVLVPPPAILAASFLAATLAGRGRRRLAIAALAALCLALPARRFVRDGLRQTPHVAPSEAFDADRRLAGIFLREHASPAEVVDTAFGWVAFESRLPTNDLSGLNSRALRAPVAYSVTHGVPWDRGSVPPAGRPDMIPLATFELASDLAPGWSWFTIFGRPDSAIARSRHRLLQYRLFELPPPETAPRADPGRWRVRGPDLEMEPPASAFVEVPSRGFPVHVVYRASFLADGDGARGAWFEVGAGGRPLWRHRVTEGPEGEPVILALPESERSVTRVRFSVTGDARSPGSGRAAWRGVKFVAGDAFVDPAWLPDEGLRAAWALHNPGAELPPADPR
jgi:hypothetical protein